MQRFICYLPDFADCQRVPGIQLQVTGKDVLQNSHYMGKFQQLTSTARRAILKLFCIKWRGEENGHTADSPHTPILCLLSANPAVASSSDPNPTVAHCSGICCRGNCLWIKCMVLQGLSAALSIPAGSRICWDTSIHGQYLYLMHSELVLQSELTCLCHPIPVLSDCHG